MPTPTPTSPHIVTLPVSTLEVRKLQEILDSGLPSPLVDPDDQLRIFTAWFDEYLRAEITVCNAEPPYIDAVFYDHGKEVEVLEPSDCLVGEYPFQDGKYMLVIKTIEGLWWLIQSDREKDENGSPLYWSNRDGWVDKESATKFTSAEVAVLSLPIDGF